MTRDIEPCEEMAKLRETLDQMGVKWVDCSHRAGPFHVLRTHYPSTDGNVSVIWGPYTYGGETGLLEAWNFRDEPVGHMTAERLLEKYPPKVEK